MTNTTWIRGALLVAAMTGCQADAINNGGTKDGQTADIAAALSQLPEASVLMYSQDGVPQFIVGDLGRVSQGFVAGDSALRAAIPPPQGVPSPGEGPGPAQDQHG